MPGAFLYSNVVRQGVGITSIYATVGALPLSNLLDPQPRSRARMIGVSEEAGFGARLVIDLLAQVPIDCVAIIGTTMDTARSPVLYRVGLSTTDATGFARDAWNTGNIAASTGPGSNGNVIAVRSAGAATGRYLEIEVHWHHAREIDIGRIAAGQLWRLARGHAYGIEEGRIILDRRDRNALTGAEFAVPAVMNPRSAVFTLPVMSPTEATTSHRELVRVLGAAEDGLWIPDIALSQSELNARSIWGAMNTPGQAAGAARTAFPVYSRGFRLTERV